MSRIFFKKQGQKPSIFVTLGLVTAGLSLLGILLAGPAVKVGLFGTIPGTPGLFELQFKLISMSMLLVLISAVLTLIGIIHARTSSRARTSWRAFVSAATIAVVGGAAWQVQSAARTAPLLHDISTKADTLLSFKILPERTYRATAPGALVGSRLDENYLRRHRTYYPDMIPIRLDRPPAESFREVVQACQRLGWQIVYSNGEIGDIEAIYKSPWFGFTSLIKLEVRAKDAGAELDIRAVSAMGHTDMGINAALIRKLKKGLARPSGDRG